MAAVPCVNHPSEMTFVRCGRCEKPICTRCMVDSPVGKKCRPCARNQTHLEQSTGRQVLQAFAGSLAVAIPAAWLAWQIPLVLLAFPYGWLVGEVGFRASQRSRSLAVQATVGMTALAGGVLGAALPQPGAPAGMALASLLNPMVWIFTGLGTMVAVSRVRYL